MQMFYVHLTNIMRHNDIIRSFMFSHGQRRVSNKRDNQNNYMNVFWRNNHKFVFYLLLLGQDGVCRQLLTNLRTRRVCVLTVKIPFLQVQSFVETVLCNCKSKVARGYAS